MAKEVLDDTLLELFLDRFTIRKISWILTRKKNEKVKIEPTNFAQQSHIILTVPSPIANQVTIPFTFSNERNVQAFSFAWKAENKREVFYSCC